MFRILSVFLLFSGFALAGHALPQDPEKAVQAAIEAYVRAGDEQDVDALQAVLHDQYRLLMHDGQKPDIFIVDKAGYLDKIATKTWGGDTRKILVEAIMLTGEGNATAKVSLTGQQADFFTYYSLVNTGGEWKIIQDLATVTFK